MSYRQLRGLYNTAALSGGVTMEDVAANAGSLVGGWNTSDPFPANDVAGLIALVQGKFSIPAETITTYLEEIYKYDGQLLSGDPMSAANTKAALVGDSPLRKKFWSYLRSKVHAGATKPLKLTKAQRLDMAKAASSRRDSRYQVLRPLPWYGSNPYGENGKRAGNYKGLAYKHIKRPFVPFEQRYQDLVGL